MKKTYSAKEKDITRQWHVVDAENAVLGRLASRVASMLKGKHKPIYTPSIDTGDHVIVVNADKIKLTGKKEEKKTYWRHSGYPGGIKKTTAAKVMKEKPEAIIRHAVTGMLPKNTIGRKMIKKLKVYAGPDHPHAAQQPKPLTEQNLFRQ
jgi:large subunit ribosomal protein L13